MNKLRQKVDTADLLADTVGRLYEAAAGFGDWRAALTAVTELTESQYAVLEGFSRGGDWAPGLFFYDSGIDPASVDAYLRFVPEHGNPRVDYARGHPREVFTDFAFIDERGMKKHPFWKELMEPLGVYYAAVAEISPRGADWAGTIHLQRSRRAGAFEPATLRLFEAIVEHGQKALRMAHQLLRSGAGAAIADSMLAADGCGYVLLDARGLIIEMNGSASRMIARSDLLVVERGELRIKDPTAQGELRRALRTSGSLSVPGRPSAPVQVGDLKIDVCPLDGNRWPVGLPVRTMLLLTERRRLIDTNEGVAERKLLERPMDERQAVCLLRELYGLTSSEGLIVLGLCRGQSVSEIAERRRTTHHAVRFHLKNVFQKLHVKRQSELVRCISLGPARFVLNPDRSTHRTP